MKTSHMNFAVPHKLTQEEAFNRVKSLSHSLFQENKKSIRSLNQQWNGNKADIRITVMGMTFKGAIEITANNVSVKLNLPFAAFLLRHQIEEQITKRLKNSLS
jgi:hypothetical protein